MLSYANSRSLAGPPCRFSIAQGAFRLSPPLFPGFIHFLDMLCHAYRAPLCFFFSLRSMGSYIDCKPDSLFKSHFHIADARDVPLVSTISRNPKH